MTNRYPCPGCGSPVSFDALRCSHCDASLLYGLIAAPVTEPRQLERAVAILSAVKGGPAPPEARRRLQGGLPLVVGVSRERAEHVQGVLVDLGLIPRLGPAPKGTRPLGEVARSPDVRARILLGALVPILAVAAFLGVDRVRSRAREVEASRAGAPPVTGYPQRRLVAQASIQRTRMGHLTLEGRVQVVSEDLVPEGELQLTLRQGEQIVSSRAFTPRSRGAPARTVRIYESLHETPLRGGERVVLEIVWDGWRAEPIELTVPLEPT